MTKIFKFLLLSSFISGLFFGNSVKATQLSDFKTTEVAENYFYPQEFDNLVLDFTIPSGNTGAEDKLQAITIQNMGTARNYYDIEKVKLWSDLGPVGFQGMAVDKEIGAFIYYDQNNSWYLNNLSELILADGLRFFVSVEIYKYASAYRSIQMQIPILSDQNGDGMFSLGDSGVFMESKNNGPVDTVLINLSIQTIRDLPSVENLSPKSVITDPKDGAILNAGTNYKIKGLAKDQGNSTVEWVKIGINDNWYDVVATDSGYSTWEYDWQNIAEGDYKLEVKSADYFGNTEIPTLEVNVKVSGAENPPVITPPAEESSVIIPPAEKPISQMTIEELKAKIVKIQSVIIGLLQQLILATQESINNI